MGPSWLSPACWAVCGCGSSYPCSSLGEDMSEQRIMVVEDEIKLASLLEDYLRIAGHATEWADNGLQVLPRLGAAPPALILLDLIDARYRRIRQFLPRKRFFNDLRALTCPTISRHACGENLAMPPH